MQERYEVVRLWVRISHGTLTVLLFLQETTIIECLNFINYNVLFMDHAIFVIFHLFWPKWQVTKRTFSQHINFFIRWHFSILMEFFHYYWKTLMVKTENIETVKINFSSFWRRFWKMLNILILDAKDKIFFAVAAPYAISKLLWATLPRIIL